MNKLEELMQIVSNIDFNERSKDLIIKVLTESKIYIEKMLNDLSLKDQILQGSLNEVQSLMAFTEQHQALMHTIFNASSDVIFILDTKFSILLSNQAAVEKFSNKGPHLEGNNLIDLIPAHGLLYESLQKFSQVVDEVSQSKTSRFYGDIQLLTGTSFIGEVIISKVNSIAGNIVTVYVRDLTDSILDAQKLDELRESAVTASKLSALGEMASSIAHEINNPLAIINYSSSYLRKSIKNKTGKEEEQIDCLNDIDQTVDRISKIISGLRNISRDSSNEEEVFCKLSEVLSDVLSICKERFKHNDIELSINISDSLLEQSLNLKRVQLSQVLVNLLGNAFDAIYQSEKDNKWVKIDIADESPHLFIYVTDSGEGIPADKIETIFEPFFTTKEVGKGTGLGLSLSKKIIESQGGTIRVDAQKKNTCFEIRLPLKVKDTIEN